MSSRFSQSKSYLKNLGISYFVEDTNLSIKSDIIESVIKSTHIFNNTILASYSWIIKASPKFDIAVIWINIWNSQNRMKAKYLINRSFNINRYIATIRETNMNPGVSQYKNCWKYGYITFICYIHVEKYQKCNRLYKLEHHR